jgi:phosphoribosyl 1,2-cyclic phosphodiesterase
MRIKIWGSRGSIPVSGEIYRMYGGNTTCLEVRLDSGEIIIIDAGTGIRELGNSLTPEDLEKPLYMLFTHSHWDHIQGFPFFTPIYNKKTRLMVYGCLSVTKSVSDILSFQMEKAYFPVPLEGVPSKISFTNECIKNLSIGDAKIDAIENNHPNQCHSLKITENGKTFVFATDNELSQKEPRTGFSEFVEFVENVDCLIHDCMYSDDEIQDRNGWGHSATSEACQLAAQGRVRRFGIFHHDPDRADAEVDRMLSLCKAQLPEEMHVFGSADHQVIHL